MSKKRNINKFATVLAYILVLVLILSVIGFLAYFSKGFTDDFKTFYLRYDNRIIMQNETGFLIEPSKEYKFYPVYTLGFATKEKPNYEVKIKPKQGVDFEYTVNGDKYLFSAISDLTPFFGVEKTEGYFTVYFNTDLVGLFAQIYNGKTVITPDFENKDYFSLIVTSGKEQIIIDFCTDIWVTDITIDKDNIIL